MKKIYIYFSYFINFILISSLIQFSARLFCNLLLPNILIEHYKFFNIIMLFISVSISIYVSVKYYTPTTNHIFHDL